MIYISKLIGRSNAFLQNQGRMAYSHQRIKTLIPTSIAPKLNNFSNNIYDIKRSRHTTTTTIKPITCLSLSSSNNLEKDDDQTITKILRESYEENETDGILQIAAPKIKAMDDYTGYDLVINALEAVNYNKGQAAGILNALIASCRYQTNNNNSQAQTTTSTTTSTTITPPDPELAWEIYNAWEEQVDQLGLYPDLVTFCCTYSVMQDGIKHCNYDDNDDESNIAYYKDCSQQVLDRAERYSKKLSGSKRRRVLASLSRRKKENKNVLGMDNLHVLKEMYGEDFNILFENDDVIVISKPSGMVCFHSHKTTDGKIRKKSNKVKDNKKKKKKKPKIDSSEETDNEDESEHENYQSTADISLEDALLDIGVQLSTLNPDAMGIVHRIDRGTSGILVLAKNNDSHAKLVTNFFTRSIEKNYLALIPYHRAVDHSNNDHENGTDTHSGCSTLQESGTINDEINGKAALSTFKVLETYGSNAIKLKVQTKTGRKHQIRIHCARALGRPIFLDPKYSIHDKSHHNNNNNNHKHPQQQTNVNDSEQSNVKEITSMINDLIPPHPEGHQFFLHASSLKIAEFDIDVESELPLWWNNVLSNLSKISLS